ncbi:hypothetical protein V8C86DRAFT_3147382 [Haematococcus lacustris]
MRVIKADVELGRVCQASWSAQFQLAVRELMGGEFTLSPDMVLGTKAMEVKWLESSRQLVLVPHLTLPPLLLHPPGSSRQLVLVPHLTLPPLLLHPPGSSRQLVLVPPLTCYPLLLHPPGSSRRLVLVLPLGCPPLQLSSRGGYWATSVAAVGRGEARMSKTGMHLNVKI